MRTVILKTAAIAALSTVALTGCGSSQSAKAEAGIVSSLDKGASSFPFTWNDTASKCAAHTIVSGVGVKQLQNYGLIDSSGNVGSKSVTDVNLSTQDATTVAGALVDCSNGAAMTYFKSKADGGITGAPAATVKCVDAYITRAHVMPMLTDMLDGKSAQAQPDFENGLKTACLSTFK